MRIYADGLFDHFLDFDIAPGVYTSLIVILIIIVVSIIIGIKARRADPLAKPKGLLLFAEMGVQTFDGMVEGYMGKSFKGFGGFVLAIAMYLFTAFIFGLTGLPSPVTYMAIPLSLGFITFILIHFYAAKFQKFTYFKRYIDPIPIFLPINLLSMWAPLLSLTLRLFGNAIAGWTIMTIVYISLENVSSMIFGFINSPVNQLFIAPFVTPILHAYFDLFSGLIQTLVFISLTMINIGLEGPQEE